MKVLIIEDEQPASHKLIRLLEEIDADIEIVDVLQSVEDAINWFLTKPKPDLIFMDVQLEDGLCFEIFETCALKTPVVFTTAYDAYMLKAFKVNSVDYLLKPMVKDELRNAIDKFKTIHQQAVDLSRIESLLIRQQPVTKERFLVKIGEHYKSVPTSSISCFYIKERCNFILVENGKSYPVDYSLDRIEQMVNPTVFFRINRNIIINFSAISDVVAYSSSRLKIILTHWKDVDEILVSRERVAEFKEWMDR
jgi:DNA-binding LytR/AlgR family response regulator